MAEESNEIQEDSLYGSATPRSFDEGVKNSGKPLDDSTFAQYEAQIFTKRRDIKEAVLNFGDKSFFDYTKSHVRENRNPIIKNRKQQLHSVIGDEVSSYLGTRIAASVVRQLKGNDSVSTIQHSVPLGHPYILNAVFQNALPYFGSNHPNLQNVIVLANSLASFNNYSYPKADALHFLDNNKIDLQQFSFFGQTREASPTIFHEPYHEQALDMIEKRLFQLRQQNKISKDELRKGIELMETIYSSPHVLSQKSYLSQLTVLNFYLFRDLMKGYSKNVPNLVFLSQEEITLKLLYRFHMNVDTILGKILFDEKVRKILLGKFNGLNGAFNIEKETGSFVFWGFPRGARYRERMRLAGEKLQSLDSSYEVVLHPLEIQRAIDRNELIPTTSFVFITLAFYYGLYLDGGLAQTTNLSSLLTVYKKFITEVAEENEFPVLPDIIANHLVFSRPLFLFMEKNGLRIPVTGLDIIIHGEKNNWEEVIESTKNIPAKDAISRMYPFYYSQFAGGKEYSEITEKDIEDYKKLNSIPTLFSVEN